MRRCIAKKVFTLTHDAPSEEAFVLATNSHSLQFTGMELDSLDAGDSMGYWIEHFESGDWEDEMAAITDDGIVITVSADWEFFTWDDGDGEIPNTLTNKVIELGLTKEKIEEIICEHDSEYPAGCLCPRCIRERNEGN